MAFKTVLIFYTNNSTRPVASETYVKELIHASLFKIVKEKEPVSYHEISNIIGASWRHVALVSKNVNDSQFANLPVKALIRKTQNDNICQKLQPYAFDFLLDDDYT